MSVTYCSEQYTPDKYKNWEQLRAQCREAQEADIEKTRMMRDVEQSKGKDKNWCLQEYKTFQEQQYCLKYK